jgi:hypothetical protein
MSLYSPCLVLYDFEPEPEVERAPLIPKRRIEQFQIVVPNETRNRFFKLKTEWRTK